MKLYLCVLLVFLGVYVEYSSSANPQSIPNAAIPPAAVTDYSASRKQRLHHNLFHIIRMNWALLDALEQQQISDLGWKPVFVSYAYINNDANRGVVLYGPTGEDFLWMHRKMINEVNTRGASAGWSVDGWDDCPAPNDPNWPVPGVPDDITDTWYIGYLSEYKSDDFYTNNITIKENQMKDPAYLRTLTFGEFGTLIEYELHTYFHVRFAAYNPVGYRIQGLHPTERIDEMWDNPQYNYLADFYSAHVNPTFWKIHGWIEKKILVWCSANSIDPNEIVWTSQWEMGPMDDAILAQLEKVAVDAIARRGKDQSRKNDAGVIVGSVFGGIVLGFIIAFIAFYCMLKLKTKNGGGHAKPAHTHESKPLKGTQVNQDNESAKH